MQLSIVVLRSFERAWAEVGTGVHFDKDVCPKLIPRLSQVSSSNGRIA
jgi:hypothetical protein